MIVWRNLKLNDRIKDLIDSAKGEIGNILLEEAAPGIVEEAAKEVLKGTALEIVSQGAGLVIPGVGNMVLSYKQKRMERNIEKFLEKIVLRQDELNKKLETLEKEQIKRFGNDCFGLVADYVLNVRQEEKIDYIVNGFVNLSGDQDVGLDKIMIFYDALDQLSMLEIRTLKVYYTNRFIGCDYEDSIVQIMEDYKMDNSQMRMIKEKLERLGLVENRNEDIIRENIQNMANYLEDINKGKKKPKLKRLNKIRNTDSYKITSFGNRFIEFFVNEEK